MAETLARDPRPKRSGSSPESRAISQIEQHEREGLFDRGLRAKDVLATHPEPLAAALDLQSRIYKTLRMDLIDNWGNGNLRPEAAVESTLLRLAQGGHRCR